MMEGQVKFVWGFLTALGIGNIAKNGISESLEKPYEAGCIDNHRLFEKDLDKVRFGETCEKCKMRKACGGIFAGTISLEKGELRAIV